jgi:hypothetical protein
MRSSPHPLGSETPSGAEKTRVIIPLGDSLGATVLPRRLMTSEGGQVKHNRVRALKGTGRLDVPCKSTIARSRDGPNVQWHMISKELFS